jgi:hypothetical protein
MNFFPQNPCADKLRASALVLCSTTGLSPSVVWSPVTNLATNQGGPWNVLVPTQGVLRFFRLAAQ